MKMPTIHHIFIDCTSKSKKDERLWGWITIIDVNSGGIIDDYSVSPDFMNSVISSLTSDQQIPPLPPKRTSPSLSSPSSSYTEASKCKRKVSDGIDVNNDNHKSCKQDMEEWKETEEEDIPIRCVIFHVPVVDVSRMKAVYNLKHPNTYYFVVSQPVEKLSPKLICYPNNVWMLYYLSRARINNVTVKGFHSDTGDAPKMDELVKHLIKVLSPYITTTQLNDIGKLLMAIQSKAPSPLLGDKEEVREGEGNRGSANPIQVYRMSPQCDTLVSCSKLPPIQQFKLLCKLCTSVCNVRIAECIAEWEGAGDNVVVTLLAAFVMQLIPTGISPGTIFAQLLVHWHREQNKKDDNCVVACQLVDDKTLLVQKEAFKSLGLPDSVMTDIHGTDTKSKALLILANGVWSVLQEGDPSPLFNSKSMHQLLSVSSVIFSENLIGVHLCASFHWIETYNRLLQRQQMCISETEDDSSEEEWRTPFIKSLTILWLDSFNKVSIIPCAMDSEQVEQCVVKPIDTNISTGCPSSNIIPYWIDYTRPWTIELQRIATSRSKMTGKEKRTYPMQLISTDVLWYTGALEAADTQLYILNGQLCFIAKEVDRLSSSLS